MHICSISIQESAIFSCVIPCVSSCSFALLFFFFSSRRRHTRSTRDWSSDVCSSDLPADAGSVTDLQRTLEWMKDYPSADAAYRARLLAIASTVDPEVSKLGLVRIA